MDKDASGMPIEQAAAELGIPSDALRLYIASHDPTETPATGIPLDQVTKLKDELRSRAGALRLDDLAKTALTIEWLASAAVQAAAGSQELDRTVAEIDRKVAESKSPRKDDELKGVIDRLGALESGAKDGSAAAIQMAGSLQGMVETQGRDLDAVRAELAGLKAEMASLRSDSASLRSGIETLRGEHHALLSTLRAAFGADSEGSAGKARAGASKPTTPMAEPKPQASDPKPDAEKVVEPEPTKPTDAAEKKFVNSPVTTPAKFRVKREIEYNFLLERMGYQRLDSLAADPKSSENIQVPDDEEIRDFLARFELGCDHDEVEMVSVQRGEYQMVQYQRVDKVAGIRSWIGRGRN